MPPVADPKGCFLPFVPADVSVAEMTSAPAGELLPEEADALGQVSDKRLSEFRDGRICARQAIAALGMPAGPIGIGAHREPLWPAGLVGSITHCDGFRAAAVARSSHYRSIGIDAEPNQALPPDLHALIMRPREQAAADRAPAGFHQDLLVFSAKESFYKAWFPLTRRWLDFTDVEVTIAPEQASFRVEMCVTASDHETALFRSALGRFKITEHHVVTLYAVEARDL